MPLIGTRGAASAQGFGEFAQSAAPVYIEDVFSTYLYTGNSGTQTITNGLDLAGKGGLVWIKNQTNAFSNSLFDSATSVNGRYYLISNLTDALLDTGTSSVPFTSSGFQLNNAGNQWNNAYNYVSWAFEKQPKFFDVVAWTGNGVSARQISHSLASTPGCIIIKRTSPTASDWWVFHRGLASPSNYSLRLNTSAVENNSGGLVATDTTFTVYGNTTGATVQDNVGGDTYVAYLFAHNAGGFGLTGAENVVSCGSYTGNGSATGPVINLGYEPQWLLIKRTTGGSGSWILFDNMRGLTVSGQPSYELFPSSTAGEVNTNEVGILSTGFQLTNAGSADSNFSGSNYIYIAIRRGPMKTPTSGTSVFSPAIYTGDGGDARLISSGFPVDGAIIDPRNGYATPGGPNWFSRLTGNGYFLQTAQTTSETNGTSNSNGIMGQDGITVSRNGSNVWSNVNPNTYVAWFLRRAPSFYDVVCFQFSGTTNTNRRVNHNLGVVPEMWIMKRRSSPDSWYGYHSALGRSTYFTLNSTAQPTPQTNVWGTANPTSTDFGVNESVFSTGTDTNIVYLFASCPGVSNVGSYTGNGTSQTINCGFASGARFVLIKETSGTGNWAVWDTARGMTSGGSPYLFLNSTAAEGTPVYVTTTSVGFNLTTSTFNSNGSTYIYLAIA